MALSVFDRPIPGQSLTDEPRNYAWERPPQIVDPEEALRFYIKKLEDPDMLDNALTILEESQMTLTGLVKGITRAGVAGGWHTIDVGLIVAPAIHEYIKGVADAVGAEYDEGLPKRGTDESEERKRAALKARDMLVSVGAPVLGEKENVSVDITTDEEPMQEETMVEETAMEEEAPMGLMARRQM